AVGGVALVGQGGRHFHHHPIRPEPGQALGDPRDLGLAAVGQHVIHLHVEQVAARIGQVDQADHHHLRGLRRRLRRRGSRRGSGNQRQQRGKHQREQGLPDHGQLLVDDWMAREHAAAGPYGPHARAGIRRSRVSKVLSSGRDNAVDTAGHRPAGAQGLTGGWPARGLPAYTPPGQAKGSGMAWILGILGAFFGWLAAAIDEEVLGLLGGALAGALLGLVIRQYGRLRALEARLARLEGRAAAAPAQAQAAAATPAAPPTPPPVPATPAPGPTPAPPPYPAGSQAAASRPARSAEPAEPGALDRLTALVRSWLFEGNVPVKIGVLVLMFGIASALKYA